MEKVVGQFSNAKSLLKFKINTKQKTPLQNVRAFDIV
jgi:hypothetical protein